MPGACGGVTRMQRASLGSEALLPFPAGSDDVRAMRGYGCFQGP